MNKRQEKKLDAKLIVAIRELNNDVALAENFPPITEEVVMQTLKRVKKSKGSINQTLNTHARLLAEMRGEVHARKTYIPFVQLKPEYSHWGLTNRN